MRTTERGGGGGTGAEEREEVEKREGASDREHLTKATGSRFMYIKSFPFSALMNILQGLKLRRDLSVCRGDSRGEGFGGDAAAAATVVCLGTRGGWGGVTGLKDHPGACEVWFQNETHSTSFHCHFSRSCHGTCRKKKHVSSGFISMHSGDPVRTQSWRVCGRAALVCMHGL